MNRLQKIKWKLSAVLALAAATCLLMLPSLEPLDGAPAKGLVVGPAGQEPAAVKGGYTFVVLPDTQNYVWKFPKIIRAQTQWIADNVKKYNIKYVICVGDVTEHNNDREWKIARDAFAKLDGKAPCAIAIGNHDMGTNGKADSRASLFAKYFPVSRLKKSKTFGGVYDKEPDKPDNSYHVFKAGGRDWLVLVLEFGPRDDVLRWANKVVAAHPNHTVLMTTHAYMCPDGKLFDRKDTARKQPAPPWRFGGPEAKKPGGLNDAKQMWDKLVSKHANFAIVLSGHVCVVAKLTSKGQAGNDVHQLLVDYQNQRPKGGNGWLRLMQFCPDGKTVKVQDYSPTLKRLGEGPDTKFELTLPPVTVKNRT